MPAAQTTTDEARVIDLLGRSTAPLMQTVQALTPTEVAEPCALPGWSRGHLLTHLANNAEGLTRLIVGSLSGQGLRMYASAEARDGDLEAGATRSGSVIVDHLQLAVAALDAAITTVSDWHAPVIFHTVAGAVDRPLREVLNMRLREVAIHHVDLASGHSFSEEDPEVIIELIRGAAMRFSGKTDGDIDLHVNGQPFARISADQPGRPTSAVDLPGATMLAWLTGRDSSQPDLPALPAWG